MLKTRPYISTFPINKLKNTYFHHYGGFMEGVPTVTPSIETDIFTGVQSTSSILNYQDWGANEIKLKIAYVYQQLPYVGQNLDSSLILQTAGHGPRAQVMANMQRVEAQMKDRICLDIGDGYEYHVILTDVSMNWDNDYMCHKEYTFSGFKCTAMETVSVVPYSDDGERVTRTFVCNSTMPKTDCVIEIPCYTTDDDATSGTAKVGVGTHVYTFNYAQNYRYLLDGINKQFLRAKGNGDWQNMITDLDWDEFPYLLANPTVQSLWLSSDAFPENFAFTCSWYPTYL